MDQIITKISQNVLCGADTELLTPDERRTLIRHSCLRDAFFVSPDVLRDQLVERPAGEQRPAPEFSANVIVMTRPQRRAVEGNQTYVFIREIVQEKKHFSETALYRRFSAGEKMRRYVQSTNGITKQWMEDDSDFRLYYDKCMRLADSLRSHGMIDISSTCNLALLPPAERKKDANVGVAIDHAGELLLFKTGQHRFALAKFLNLKKIPVSVRAISGEYLSKFLRKPGICDQQDLLDAISAATGHVGNRDLRPVARTS